MTKSPPPECPEYEKMKQIADENNTQSIGLFLDYYLRQHGYTICKWDEEEEIFYQAGSSPERIIAECFDIDLDKVDDERRALLEWIQGESL